MTDPTIATPPLARSAGAAKAGNASEAFTLVIDGKPTGKGRPRFVRATGRTYTDARTESAESRVHAAWLDAGRPRIDGPLKLSVCLEVARPKDHYRADGVTLTAKGERTPLPVRKPDLDNAAKLVMDALNGCAYRDDVDVVELTVWREWGDRESTHVKGETLDA